MRNVSRAWAYETGLAAGVELGPGMNEVPKLNKVETDEDSKRNTGQRILRIFWAGL